MISCIIIEDQAPAQRILQRYIDDFEELQLKGVFTNAIEALDYLKTNQINLIFLDIHLPKLSGIDFLSILNPHPYIILTTAFQDYAIKSYELDVVDYLLKPFSFNRFLKAVFKVQKLMNLQHSNKPFGIENKSILIKSGYNHIKVQESDILFIKSEGDFSFIYTPQKKILASDPLKYWEDTLSENRFTRVHKSYIVSLKNAGVFSSSAIQIREHHIPIGRTYKKSFLEKMNIS
jgi:DNA-binding LytR/AlgR family response regulator